MHSPWLTRHSRPASPTHRLVLQALQLAAAARRRLTQASDQDAAESAKLARARLLRERNLLLLKEQMGRNWSMWHPECRPASAQPVEHLRGFEEVPSSVVEYARYLGMSLTEDAEFLWVAEEGLSAELPPEWSRCKDPEGLIYFHQPATGVSSRQHPSDEHYRALYYSSKFGGAAEGGYLSTLISRISSRHITDSLKSLSRQDIERVADAFGKFDPERTGVITLSDFMVQLRATGREYTDARLRAMFEAADLTGTSEVDFNEFVLMQLSMQRKRAKGADPQRRKDRQGGGAGVPDTERAGPETSPQQTTQGKRGAHQPHQPNRQYFPPRDGCRCW